MQPLNPEREIMNKLFWFLSSLVLLSLLSVSAVFGQGTQITFETSAVVATGLAPGDAVVWYGVEYRIDAEFSGDIKQHLESGTVAADGTVRLDLDQPVADRSFWVVVDLASGRHAVAGASGFPLTRPEQAPQLAAGQGSDADAIFDQRPYLMGLVVRPGTGAWSFEGGDGGPRDMDGRIDGQVSFALDSFDPLTGSPASPAKVSASDLWFVVDPYTMEISVSQGGVAQ
jgi:hypothetical protein